MFVFTSQKKPKKQRGTQALTQTSGSTNKARETFLKIMHVLGGKQQNIPVHAIIDQRKDDIKSRDRSKICTCEQ